jgi:hypothetical protein
MNKEESKTPSNDKTAIVKEVYLDLIREKNKNRNVVMSLAAAFVISLIAALFFAYSVYKNESGNQYAVSAEGNVSKLSRVKVITEVPSEALFHCSYMYNTFYTYSHSNLRSALDAGLRLLDLKDAKTLKTKWEPWFKRVGEENLTQKAYTSPEQGNEEYFQFFKSSFKIRQLSSNIFEIEVKAKVEVSNANFVNLYVITINSKLKRVDRDFPTNPHGFIFFDYKDQLQLEQENIPLR